MQVTKDGIERIKGANDLAPVVAERGIEVRRRGRVAVAAVTAVTLPACALANGWPWPSPGRGPGS